VKPGVHEEMRGLGKPFFCLLQKTSKDSSSPSRSAGRLPTKHHHTISQMQTVATATARTTFIADESVRHRRAH